MRRFRVIIQSVGVVLLAACAHTPPPAPKIVQHVVTVPVAKACVPADLNLDPAFPDTDAALRVAPGPGDLMQLLAAGRLLRVQTLSEWRAALAACR